MKRIVAVLGDSYHPFEPIQISLEKVMQTKPAFEDVEVSYVGANELVEALRSLPDAVVLYKENRVHPQTPEEYHWMTEETSLAIARYVDEGGGWLAWHSGLASYPIDSTYTDLLKGYFISHPEQHDVVRYVLSGDGIDLADRRFEILDEHFFVHCEETSTEVFLVSESREGKSIAGWRHPVGEGRVCCLTPAHHPEGLEDDRFTAVLAECLQWCGGI
jgi:type 1 glutamine amidotransferase